MRRREARLKGRLARPLLLAALRFRGKTVVKSASTRFTFAAPSFLLLSHGEVMALKIQKCACRKKGSVAIARIFYA